MYFTDILQRSLVAIYLQKPLPQSPKQSQEQKPKACFLGLLQRSLVAILYYIYKSHCPKAPKKARRKAQSMFSCLPAGHYSIITAGQPCASMFWAAPLAIQPAIPSSILPSSPLPSWTPILSLLRQEKIEVEPIETPKPNPCPAGKQHHGAHIGVEHLRPRPFLNCFKTHKHGIHTYIYITL